MLSGLMNISAQTGNSNGTLTILVNSSFTDTIQSYFPPVFIPTNCSVTQPVSIGGGKFVVTITPNLNFVGNATALCQYFEFKPPFNIQPKFRNYSFNVVTAIVKSTPDFVRFNTDETITIFPLANDYSSTGIYILNNIAQVQYGSATFSGDTIFYTPQPGIEDDYIIYSLKDTLGTSDIGIVYLNRIPASVPQSLNLSFNVTNVQSKLVFLPDAGYSSDVNALPSKGKLSQKSESVYEYTPAKNSIGNDSFRFVDANDNEVLVNVKILNKSPNTSSVVDDVVYTPANTSVTFNVLSNDLSSNFPISQYSSALTLVSPGVFSYTPPTGYTGIKTFTYTVNYGTYQSTGKIFVNVGNFSPQANFTYSFNTVKNKAFVIDYQMPISGYSFEILSATQYGSLEVFDENTTLDLDCHELNGKAIIVYQPYNNYIGSDEFDIRYCINGAQCQNYKVNLQVLNIDADSSCICVGRACVWPGDANGDGRVSISDLLPIGRFMGHSGNSREENSIPLWSGEHSNDWAKVQPNGKNIKYADTNGDGIISEADVESINTHFSHLHNLVPKEDLGIKDYPFMMIPNVTELDSGDLLVLDIIIGSNNTPVADIHGLAFTFNIDPQVIDSSSFDGYFFENSWFSSGNPSLQLIKQPVAGNIHAAFTRTGGLAASGNGIIGQFSIVVDEIDGFKTSDDFIEFRIQTDGIEMEESDGSRFNLEDSYLDLKLKIKKSQPVPTEDKLLMFPNPSGDRVRLHFNGRNMIYTTKVTDLFGNLVLPLKQIHDNQTDIDVSALPSGIYSVQIMTSEGVITKKMNVVH